MGRFLKNTVYTASWDPLVFFCSTVIVSCTRWSTVIRSASLSPRTVVRVGLMSISRNRPDPRQHKHQSVRRGKRYVNSAGLQQDICISENYFGLYFKWHLYRYVLYYIFRLDLTRSMPTQPNPLMDPTRVQICVVLSRHALRICCVFPVNSVTLSTFWISTLKNNVEFAVFTQWCISLLDRGTIL